MIVSHAGSLEIIQIADSVAREKNIDRNFVLEGMEDAIAIAARKKYGHDKNIKAAINRKTGEIVLTREMQVVEDDFVADEKITAEGEEKVNEDSFYIRLSDALAKDENAKVGQVISELLPPIDLGRVAAQTAKQVIIQKVREAERMRQYDDFKARIGEIVHGVVKRVEFGSVIVDLGNVEAIIRREEMIKGENFRINERIRAYLLDVRRESKGPQLFLSRTSDQFMAKLFMQEVPEIYDNIIQIKSVAREPGSRAKIAVYSTDSSIDPVGSCVGVRGARVQAVTAELNGEKIDIIQYSPDPATFLISALAPAEISKVVIDEENNRIEAVVAEDQLSLAIGRRGQNVRLASKLVGWGVDILTEADESSRRSEDFTRISNLFTEALNVEEIIAHLLASEGFSSVEEIAYVEPAELTNVEGFDEDIVAELQNRAQEYLNLQQAEVEKELKKLKVKEDLINFEGLTKDDILQLARKDIKSLDDFAGLSRDEFFEIVPNSEYKAKDIDALIMKAREICL